MEMNIFHQRGLLNSPLEKVQCKTLECSICNRKFKKNSVLNIHINAVHLKLKPNKCTVCDYRSYFKSNIKKHIQSVHGKSSSSARQENSYKREFFF